ncbi:nucleotide excision repair endonuclease [Bacillus badius]|uniref:Endo/excinuclease amino terminal domain protein n=1 Tax=Bacillus badius TaxID=1455 RepID=A0ABR5AZY1_BACBA|nr:nucleotide excision repair endonuclease [Bacillus badius]KIL73293.1 Endo/excinuclease amino terminal domain protein [Bacillus badius]KIL80301.1 Endo/excinuclease amino terminal domain protein [Bacillus badius]KZR56797.1 nucleotide excision repair endonuclease [Bacillus badius]MED4716929.1 nucleotide excision repair endonuclease [Bacillus badius]
MIKIELPQPDLTIVKKNTEGDRSEAAIAREYGFIDYHKIARDKGGIYMYYDAQDELMFVGKARKLRMRVRKSFEDAASPIKLHRDDVYKIEVCYVEDPMEREIYETYIINTLKSKYNIDKAFFR